MDSTLKDYWHTWLWRDTTTRIITVNTIAFIVIAGALLFVPRGYQQWWVELFALPASIFALPSRIWTIGTYMISHIDFLHLLVNMLWLMLFGRMIEHAAGSQRLLAIYVIGGLAGAAAFVVSNLVRYGMHPYMLGASCAVIAVVGASLAIMPTWRVNLLFFGEVKVLWVGIAALVLFVVLEPSLYVSIAHGAGFVAGYAYGYIFKHGWLKLPAKTTKSLTGAQVEARLDQLLDKVHRSGYASLSARERQELFNLSQRTRKGS